MPYAPQESRAFLAEMYEKHGKQLWGPFGFYDAFNFNRNWVSNDFLAIDQGPEVVMIENYRSGLLWRLFMSCPEVQTGLKRLGFNSPWIK